MFSATNWRLDDSTVDGLNGNPLRTFGQPFPFGCARRVIPENVDRNGSATVFLFVPGTCLAVVVAVTWITLQRVRESEITLSFY